MSTLQDKALWTFMARYPNSKSTKMWQHSASIGIHDYGSFGNALKNGNIDEAISLADFENRKKILELISGGYI